MLDVHPPHEAAHTWKDFFIHIATIVIGLIIAVGLEQAVEAIHHSHQEHHARELLAQEMADNHKLVLRQQYTLAMHENYLFQDLLVIDRLRSHALLPTDRMVLFHPYVALVDTAWQTAKESNADNLFPYEEAQRYAYIYDLQGVYNDTESDSTIALQNANTMFYNGPADRFDPTKSVNAPAGGDAFSGEAGDAMAHLAFEAQAPGNDKLNRLTPAQIDRLEQAVQQSIYQDEKLLNRCHWLSKNYETFGQ
jgi:hypothetical protein